MDSLETMSVRVDEQLKSDFMHACRLQDRTASQVVRQAMKVFIIESARAYEDKCNEETKNVEKEKSEELFKRDEDSQEERH